MPILVISELGPFFAYSLKSNAAILTHYMLNDAQQALSWLPHDKVIVLDRALGREIPQIRTTILPAKVSGYRQPFCSA